ncbi:nitrate- and nitrite sensing domain-containing protein [Actinomadura xylanilytica]|uniref:nitrate- and nitrite sensing domain-containing protein n=1 Tax=Actinomadura xylanilytica TaxID=887459 RepID=UPI00255A794A|nr:nitrate- and nitrite sensing domain-containing protein [Actinomadura xylanilytica]MDL4775508.1 nitrate- and nitrite sensing domain-containing protein [Actinomadura xylanilytica]
MVLVSVVSLAVLWAFAASIALGEGLNLRHVKTVQEHYGYPAGALGSALQAERRASMVYLGSKAVGDQASMESARLVTDRQADLFRGLVKDPGARDSAPVQARRLTDKIGAGLDALAAGRRSVDSGATVRTRAYADYTALLADVGTLQGTLSTLDNSEVAKDARSQASLARAREILSQEDALLAGVLAAGRMTAGERAEFTKLVGTQRSLYAFTAGELRPADQSYYQRVVTMPEAVRLRQAENYFISLRRMKAGGSAGVAWKTTADSNLTRLRGLELSVAAAAEARAKPISDTIILRVVLAGALGLVAVIASLVLAVWVARSVIRELARLRREALDLADVRLPGVIARLRRGEEVDVAAEAPPLSFGTREIDQVGDAFNAARRTAIQGAVEEAALRRNVSDVFVNLARRSQTLLHRQLNLLDAMERRMEAPDELEDLFRVDHLATRMRRHAEGLIILSGQAPGRGWRSPVGIIDVARAAASEVEDYTRVNVAPMPQSAVLGPAVADVIHLLAELIENAASFSPPHTTVQVSGQAVAHGFTLEVEDRGLSMDEVSLRAANERLATAAEFDLSDSAQLGLFVVGRLAHRHGIKVTLRTSPYGGMTAIVLLPEELVVRADAAELESAPVATRRAEDALVPVGSVMGGGRRHAVAELASGPAGPGGHDANGAGGSVLQLPTGRHAAGSTGSGAYEVVPDAQGGGPSNGGPSNGGPSNGGPSNAGPSNGGPGSRPGTPFGAASPQGGAPPGGMFGEAPSGPPEGENASPGDVAAASRTVFEEPIQGSAPSRRSGTQTGPQRLPRSPREVRRRPSGGTGGGGGGGRGGRPSLPKRVRQENLAAQLRDEAAGSAPEASGPSAPERSPEDLRTMMSAIQQGTRRGRAEAIENDDEGS